MSDTAASDPYQAPQTEVEPPAVQVAPNDNSLSLFSFAGICAVFAAALAMATTMPGRTHILGLITVPLLKDFPDVSDTAYANINLAVTLISSLFCFPAGWLIDRVGIKHLGFVLVLLLAVAVLSMSYVTDPWILGIHLTVARGIGQSMLSIISLAIIGKSFPSKSGPVMGMYAVIMTIFMVIGMVALQGIIPTDGWRAAWYQLGVWLAISAPVLWFLTPLALDRGITAESETDKDNKSDNSTGSHATWLQALAAPSFWTFAISISLFGLITSGFSLFQEKIFAEQGLAREVYYLVQVLGLGVGLLTNIGCGLLARYVPLERLLCAAMLILAVAMGWMPYVDSRTEAIAFGVVYAIGGGMLSVLFYTVWSHAFGTEALGRIQGTVQFFTVLASAAGPIAIAGARDAAGSYHPILWGLGIVCLALGLGSLFASVPSAERGDWSPERSTS